MCDIQQRLHKRYQMFSRFPVWTRYDPPVKINSFLNEFSASGLPCPSGNVLKCSVDLESDEILMKPP